MVFRAIRPKLCENCAFPQNSQTKKLVEITVFFTVNKKKKTGSWKTFCVSHKSKQEDGDDLGVCVLNLQIA